MLYSSIFLLLFEHYLTYYMKYCCRKDCYEETNFVSSWDPEDRRKSESVDIENRPQCQRLCDCLIYYCCIMMI